VNTSQSKQAVFVQAMGNLSNQTLCGATMRMFAVHLVLGDVHNTSMLVAKAAAQQIVTAISTAISDIADTQHVAPHCL